MLEFYEAYAHIANLAQALPAETCTIDEAHYRVLREDILALRDQPAADISAMDGYALAGEFKHYPIRFEIPAGQTPPPLEMGEAARIFTGGLIPQGADRVLIQEQAQTEIRGEETWLIPQISAKTGEHIRPQGLDFTKGTIFHAPTRLNAGKIALIAAMNHHEIRVSQKPKIAIIANGSELVLAGNAQFAHQTIASNSYAIKAFCESLGAKAEIRPILPDDLEQITAEFQRLDDYDLIVSTGGASVGDYDYMLEAAKNTGFEIHAHKIAMRPGKPVMAGRRGTQLFLGLPGNPISALITARIFLKALIERLLGLNAQFDTPQYAILDEALEANKERMHFMRATLAHENNQAIARPFKAQDSSLLSVLNRANILIIREPYAQARQSGERVAYIPLNL